MLNNLMTQLTEHQKVDGEVERAEFDPRHDREGWPEEVDPADRQKIERYVFGKTPSHHTYKTADGEKGIVFFDSRGRATNAVISEMDGEELLRLARSYGKRMKGDKTSRPSKDPGYTVPDLAEAEERIAEVEKRILAEGGPRSKRIKQLVRVFNFLGNERRAATKPDYGTAKERGDRIKLVQGLLSDLARAMETLDDYKVMMGES